MRKKVPERTAGLVAANARLREKIAELEKAEEARHELLSVAAHELKTPLTSLRGFAQLVVRQIEDGDALDRERLRQALTAIDQQSVKLARRVSQLLDLSRLEAGRLELEPQVSDVVGLVQAVVSAAGAASERHVYSLRAPPAAPAYVDPIRIEQVLANLLDYAAKHSPSGGPIEVEVSRPRGGVRIAVTSIAPEQRPRKLDRFDQAPGGPGLGTMGLELYISRQIVELHGGRIEVESPRAGGTRFVITLPLKSPSSPRAS